jgi:hypothetical protein
MKLQSLLAPLILIPGIMFAQAQTMENGIHNLFLLSDAKSRSVSPENLTGRKGEGGATPQERGSAGYAARELGQGWKVNPYVTIKPGETFTMASIEGPGIIRHIWMTPTGDYRLTIFRMYWDGEAEASVEAPVGDFFCTGWGWDHEPQISSLAICVNPKNGFNSYWQMPFRTSCRVTMENASEKDVVLYYQIDYSETAVPQEAAYFHAQFRRMNPLPFKQDYTIVDGIQGKGHFVGTYLAHGTKQPGWFGEGEAKFFIDGDTKFPTICGTGEEDYFNGSYGYHETQSKDGSYQYTDFTTPYTGFYWVRDTVGMEGKRRFGEYRWHITDPVRFQKDLRVTIQCLGWQSEGRYLPLQDDLASVAYWYQNEPHHSFPKLPARDQLRLGQAK